MKNGITQARLKELLQYDYNTGLFTRKVSLKGGAKKGAIAGGIDITNGYRQVRVDGRKYQEHRLVFLYHYGELPMKGIDVDHINLDKVDNSFDNLRLCTSSQNSQNRRKRTDNKSGFKGASLHTCGKYQGLIQRNGKSTYLGLYDTAELAHAAYCVAAHELFGEFANTG